MKKNHLGLCLIAMLFCLWSAPSHADNMKEWTFLTFLNGHNNLDSYGAMNIGQMEQIGSTDQLNIVVQWASSAAPTTQRIFVKKGSHDVVQDMPRVDMGNYQSLVEFVRWGVQNYPAKHYFINIWNHGGGWHKFIKSGGVQAQDISWDDFSGNHITTEDLGVAMSQSAQIIGHKVDIYGSDACLMAMGEVTGEMADTVAYTVGSEETEPGNGWPYGTFLSRWAAAKAPTSAQVSSMLAEEYGKAYSNGGVYGATDITFSAMDMSQLPNFWKSASTLARELNKLNAVQIKNLLKTAQGTQSFAYSDYKDMGDFVSKIKATAALEVDRQAVADVEKSIQSLVISNHPTGSFANTAHGISVWIPTDKYDWTDYQQRYQGLRFQKETGWSSFLSRFF